MIAAIDIKAQYRTARIAAWTNATCRITVSLPWHERDRTERAARPTLDLHRQGNEQRPADRKLVEVREVLEARDVARRRNAVDLEIGGSAVVDRGGVDAKG